MRCRRMIRACDRPCRMSTGRPPRIIEPAPPMTVNWENLDLPPRTLRQRKAQARASQESKPSNSHWRISRGWRVRWKRTKARTRTPDGRRPVRCLCCRAGEQPVHAPGPAAGGPSRRATEEAACWVTPRSVMVVLYSARAAQRESKWLLRCVTTSRYVSARRATCQNCAAIRLATLQN